MNDIYFGEEDAKYTKSKPKKKVKKSSHKHSYDGRCVAINDDRKFILNKSLVEYCTECGKINNIYFFPNQDTIKRLIEQKRYFNVKNSKELFSMKYVPIELKD